MLCPTAPSLPWVAWASLPHLRRYYAPLRLPPCPSRVASLVAHFPIPCMLPCVCGLPCGLVSWWKPRGSRQGLWSPGPPFREFNKETGGSPKFPSYPYGSMPPLFDPGGVLRTRQSAPRTAAFRSVETVGFPLRTTLRGILVSTTIHISGLNH